MIYFLCNKMKQVKSSLGFLHTLVCTSWLLIVVSSPLECWAARVFLPTPGRDAGCRKESIFPPVHVRNPKVTFAEIKTAQECELKGFFSFLSHLIFGTSFPDGGLLRSFPFLGAAG